MSLPALASIDSLVAMLGGPTGAELARAQAVLNLASIEVRFVAREDWVTDDDPPTLVDDVPPIVAKITLEVAQRAFLNPADGTRQESLGDHAKTYDNRQGVYLTDDEKATVRAAASADVPVNTGLMSVRVEAPRYAAGVPARIWCDDDDEAVAVD